MKDYILLFRVGPRFQQASPEELQQVMMRSKDWVAGIAGSGKLSGVVRLLRTGVVLKKGGREVTEGPYTEGQDIVNGYVAIKAASFDEAVSIAKENPIFDYEGVMEVREAAPKQA
jgi:hypothetical protein